MIPADVASRLRLVAQEQPVPPQPVAPSGKLTDILSDLVPGQRVMAEIQALLPNGTYRAVVAQREVTLALPFSAKPGDALELEVVESDGKLTLAFVASRTPADQAKPDASSVATTLSRTGRLIGELLENNNGQEARPVPLNGNQPLLENFAADASQLAPLLKEAITKSGMFYEAHQANWVEGKLATEALLEEPQGRFSIALKTPPPSGEPEQIQFQDHRNSATGQPSAGTSNLAGTMRLADSTKAPQSSGAIPPDLSPLVRQQLDALASQHYLWQGQIWPGQQLHWEIEDQGDKHHGDTGIPDRAWQTRLTLTLPNLGSIDAVMVLRGSDRLDISIVAGNDEIQQMLAAAQEALRRQLDASGLSLANMAVQHGEQTR